VRAQLVLSGLELYGKIHLPQQEGILKPSHWFFQGCT